MPIGYWPSHEEIRGIPWYNTAATYMTNLDIIRVAKLSGKRN